MMMKNVRMLQPSHKAVGRST